MSPREQQSVETGTLYVQWPIEDSRMALCDLMREARESLDATMQAHGLRATRRPSLTVRHGQSPQIFAAVAVRWTTRGQQEGAAA